MSSYDPPDESDEEGRRDPGAQGKEVYDNRDFSEVVTDLDRIDYVKIGVVLSFPAGLVTAALVFQFFPGVVDWAGEVVRRLLGI